MHFTMYNVSFCMSTCIHIGFNCNASGCKETMSHWRCVTKAQCRDSPCLGHRTVSVSYLSSPKQSNISEPQIPFPPDYISKRSHVFPYPWDNAGWCAEGQLYCNSDTLFDLQRSICISKLPLEYSSSYRRC